MNNKLLIMSTTKGGHIRHTFCPNLKVGALTEQYIKSRGGRVLYTRNYSDTKYLESKIRIRTDELMSTVQTYRMVVNDLNYLDSEKKDMLTNTLLTSIEGLISTLFGLIRRVESKGYNIDVEDVKEFIDMWLEREEY